MESVPLMWRPVTASPVGIEPMTIFGGGGPTVGVRGVAPYFSGLGWFGADAKKRKVEK